MLFSSNNKMINMKKQESEYFKWQEEYGKYREKKGIEKGIKKGEKRIIKKFLKTMSPEEIAEKTDMPISEIRNIAEYQ